MIQIEQLRKVMNEISAEKGEFILFGLFLREEMTDKWDLVIAAPWLEAGRLERLREFVERMAPIVGEDGMLTLSRIVTLNQGDPSLDAILKDAQVENGLVKLQGSNLFGLPINEAYILQAKQPSESNLGLLDLLARQ